MINFRCPKCNDYLSVPESLAGSSEKCPNCDNICIIPNPLPSVSEPVLPTEPQVRSKSWLGACVISGILILVSVPLEWEAVVSKVNLGYRLTGDAAVAWKSGWMIAIEGALILLGSLGSLGMSQKDWIAHEKGAGGFIGFLGITVLLYAIYTVCGTFSVGSQEVIQGVNVIAETRPGVWIGIVGAILCCLGATVPFAEANKNKAKTDSK